jgi:hypothetical protein
MAEYLGKHWTKKKLLAWIGDPAQIAGARFFEYTEGKAQGVRGVSVQTGGGLQFTVLPGRGMDIPAAFFQGNALSFFSGTGITSPSYYEEPGLGWLRSFFAGLLTTCGIANSGAPSTDMGEHYGLHGRVTNAAAENVCVDQHWENDEYVISLKGMMREAKAMFEHLTLTRTIETCLGSRSFRIMDMIENRGFEPQPLMMLYHFNFGFPLLGPNARIVGPVIRTEPRDGEAARDRGVEECMQFPDPVHGYNEKVFFHTLDTDRDGNTFMALLNRDIGDGTALGIVIRFNKNQLPTFTEWKMPREGFYVLGLEPGTAEPLGRGVLRESGKLPLIEGQHTHEVVIDFHVLRSKEELDSVEREAEEITRG